MSGPAESKNPPPGGVESSPEIDFGRVIVRAVANSHGLEGLVRPLLEALTKLAHLESTYLTVFDWERREQEVRFVHSTGEEQIAEGLRSPLPRDLPPEALPGVTRSPSDLARTHPDSQVARQLGLKRYVSVPVTVAKHQLFGMLCGASREPGQVSEGIVSVMEFFAQIIADHVTRAEAVATEQRAQAAEEQLRSRARFLAMAEHKLKTPLTALEGMSMTLLKHWAEASDSQRTELLTGLVQNAQELRSRIDNLLVEARADVQARELSASHVELGPLVKTLAKAFGSVSTKHEVIAEAPEGIVAWIDQAALYQVLGHLLDNAIKYSPGGGKIWLRATRTASDVRIEVVDEGLGVPEHLDIFEPFQRAEPSEAEVTPGIGLGLHIVRSLVNAMGGSVAARRNEDRGSTFTVHVPSAPS